MGVVEGQFKPPDGVWSLLYGSAPSVILSSADGSVARTLGGLMGVDVILFDNDVRCLRFLTGEIVRLSDLCSPPTFPCLLFAASDGGRCALAGLVRWWSDSGGLPPPLEVCDRGATVEGICNLALRALLARTVESGRRTARSSLALYHQILELRKMNEEAHAIISDLRAATNPVRPTLAVACEPSGDSWVPTGECDGIVFRFPFRARGLSQLDLHFRKTGESVGSVSVKLIAAEEARVLGSWGVPFEQLGGWLQLRFPRAISFQSHFLKLKIGCRTEVGPPPGLSLSDELVQPKGLGPIDAPMAAVRLPAIRLYVGNPGQEQPACFWRDPR